MIRAVRRLLNWQFVIYRGKNWGRPHGWLFRWINSEDEPKRPHLGGPLFGWFVVCALITGWVLHQTGQPIWVVAVAGVGVGAAYFVVAAARKGRIWQHGHGPVTIRWRWRHRGLWTGKDRNVRVLQLGPILLMWNAF